MAKRPKGEGAFYWSESHNRYEATVTINGKKKTVASSTKGTKTQKYRECSKKLAEAKRLAEVGLDAAPGEQTVKAYMEEWTDAYKTQVRDSTFAKRRFAFDRAIAEFGLTKLKDLGPKHIQTWVTGMAKDLAPSSIEIYYGLFKKALADAVERGYLLASPCRGIKCPRIEEEEMMILDSEQRRIFLDFVKGHRHETLFVTTLMTAMRSGEVRGLRWEDIHLDKEEVDVRETLVYISRQGYEQHKPKTKAGKRAIPLVEPALTKLRQHRTAQRERYLSLGIPWSEQELVFQGRRPGAPFSEDAMRDALARILEAAGLPRLRVHDLRHTGITYMLLAGAQLKTVMKWAGHANVEQTLHYVHILPETLQKDIQSFKEAALSAIG